MEILETSKKIAIKLKKPTLTELYEKKNQHENSTTQNQTNTDEKKTTTGINQEPNKPRKPKNIKEYFSKVEKPDIEKKNNTNTPRKETKMPSPPRPKSKPKKAQCLKKSKIKENEMKIAQQRGFWLKLAENQKRKDEEKTRKPATIVKEGNSEDMPTEFKVLEQVHCKKTPGAQSCTPVRRGESNVSRLSHTRGEIMFESEIKKNNCSGGSTQIKMIES